MTIGGVEFVSRRRTTAVMARARGLMAVLGQASAMPSDDEVTPDQFMALAEGLMRAAVISPVIAPAGEPTIAGQQYAFDDVAFAADKWLPKFMATAVDVDPTPPSCEA
jgi:hypothetical protein